MIVSIDKEHILAEIRRTAKENGNRPLGVQRFAAETGIRETDWHGKLWARWGDALREAGFEANTLVEAYESDFLLGKYIELTRELGRFPVKAELSIVHKIITDDPIGIERCWHKRFEAKRANGEWFALSSDDVAAFRRRKTM